MEFLILVALTLLPGVFLGRLIYNKDKDKEPKKLIVKLLIFGGLSIIPAIIGELLFEAAFTYDNSFFSYFLYFTLGVALIEEFSKFLPAYFIGIKSKAFDDVYDAIVYTAFSAVGFATLENFEYVFLGDDGGLGTAIVRLIFSVPGHIGYGILMGYFLGIAYNAKTKGKSFDFYKNLALSLIVPSLFHGVYDSVLFFGGEYYNIVGILLVFVIDLYITIYAFIQAKKVSDDNEKLDTDNMIDKVGKRLVITAVLSVVVCCLVCNTEFLNWGYLVDEDSQTEVEEYDEDEKYTHSIDDYKFDYDFDYDYDFDFDF